MKFISTSILSVLLLPILVGAGDSPVALTSPVSGFAVTIQNQNLLVTGAIDKGFWENPILNHGGTITAYASVGDDQVSEQIEAVVPVLNPTDKIKGYNFGVSLYVEGLRGETGLPIKVAVEARNHKGELEDYDEIWGTIAPIYTVPLEIILSQNTPSSTAYEKGSTDNKFTEIIFNAEESLENVKINQLVLTRSGGADGDLSNVRIFDGSTQIGSLVSFVGGKATFADLQLVTPHGLSKTVMVKADVNASAGIYDVENGISIGIESASDIQAIGMDSASAVTIDGSFPVIGNPMGIQ